MESHRLTEKNDTRSGKGDRPLSTFFLAFSICGLSDCGKATLIAENSVKVYEKCQNLNKPNCFVSSLQKVAISFLSSFENQLYKVFFKRNFNCIVYFSLKLYQPDWCHWNTFSRQNIKSMHFVSEIKILKWCKLLNMYKSTFLFSNRVAISMTASEARSSRSKIEKPQ